MTKIRVRCPVCKVEAEIDKEKGEVIIHLPPLEVPRPFTAFRPPLTVCFPSHSDCEINKPIDKIDLDKLIKVEQP